MNKYHYGNNAISNGNKIFLENYLKKDKIKKCKSMYYQSELFILDIPENIQYIQYTRNKNICEYLPDTLKHLYLGGEFDHPINKLPSQLKILQLSGYFNQDVNNLPQGLEKIIFGNYFNKSVDLLPESLIYVEFGHNFNQDISNLPIGIKIIKIKYTYKKIQLKLLLDMFGEKIIKK